jgi:hypothetical protein
MREERGMVRWSAEKVWVPFIGLEREETGRPTMVDGAKWSHKLSEGEEWKMKRKGPGCEGDRAPVGSPSSKGHAEGEPTEEQSGGTGRLPQPSAVGWAWPEVGDEH